MKALYVFRETRLARMASMICGVAAFWGTIEANAVNTSIEGPPKLGAGQGAH